MWCWFGKPCSPSAPVLWESWDVMPGIPTPTTMGPAGRDPPRVARRQGFGTHGCCQKCQSFQEVPGTHSGHAASDFLGLKGWWSLCVSALKPRPESVVMRFYDVFWQGLVILCVDLLSNELSDFEMFCATLFWKGHCILFMGCVSFYETLFSF